MTDPDDPRDYYRRLGPNLYLPTVHTQGAWAADQQHMAPVSGLLTAAIEACQPRDDLMISRVSFDILGVITMDATEVETRVIRPGRTIELVEAELRVAGRAVVRATAWRLAVSDTSAIAGSAVEPMPGPDEGLAWTGASLWDGGYIRGLEFRALPGWEPGRGRVWLRTTTGLIEGEPSSALSRYIGLVDTANGIAARCDPTTLLFPNTDLTIHLVRRPVGEWVGLDTTVTFGADGVGLTATVLHDVDGPIGRAAQTLTLRPLAGIEAVRPPRTSPFPA